MSEKQIRYICRHCLRVSTIFLKRCPQCGRVDTMLPESVTADTPVERCDSDLAVSGNSTPRSVSVIFAPEDISFALYLKNHLNQTDLDISIRLESIEFSEASDSMDCLMDDVLVILSPKINNPALLHRVSEHVERKEGKALFILIQSINERFRKQLEPGSEILDLRSEFRMNLGPVKKWLRGAQIQYCSSPGPKRALVFDKHIPAGIRFFVGFFLIAGILGALISLLSSVEIFLNVVMYSQPLQSFIQMLNPIILLASLFLLLTNTKLLIAGIKYYSRIPSGFLGFVKEYRSIHISVGLALVPICCCLVLFFFSTEYFPDYHTHLPVGLMIYTGIGLFLGMGSMKWAPDLFDGESTITLWQVPVKKVLWKESRLLKVPGVFPKNITILFNPHDEPFARILGEELKNRNRIVSWNCQGNNSDYYIILLSRWLFTQPGLMDLCSLATSNEGGALVVQLEDLELPAIFRRSNIIYPEIDVNNSLSSIFKFLSNEVVIQKNELAQPERNKDTKEPTFFSRTDMFMFFLWVINAFFSLFWFPFLIWHTTSIPIYTLPVGFLLVLGSVVQAQILQTDTVRERKVSLPVYLFVNILVSVGVFMTMVITWDHQFNFLKSLLPLFFILFFQVTFFFLAMLQIKSLSYWLPTGFVFGLAKNWDVNLLYLSLALCCYLPALSSRLFPQ